MYWNESPPFFKKKIKNEPNNVISSSQAHKKEIQMQHKHITQHITQHKTEIQKLKPKPRFKRPQTRKKKSKTQTTNKKNKMLCVFFY